MTDGRFVFGFSIGVSGIGNHEERARLDIEEAFAGDVAGVVGFEGRFESVPAGVFPGPSVSQIGYLKLA